MPLLRNVRQEQFCRLIVEGRSANQAYVDAGYKPNRGNSAKLRGYEIIEKRINELMLEKAAKLEEKQQQVAQDLAIDRAWLMRKLGTVIAMAEAKQDANAVVNAIKELGVLSGERIEKSEHGRPGEFAAIEAMSRAELEASIVKLVRQIEDDEPKLLAPPTDD